MDLTPESPSDTDNNPDISLLPNVPVITNKKGSAIKTPPKRKRKYASKRPKEGIIERSKHAKKRIKDFQKTKVKDSTYKDLTDFATYNESHMLSNKIINPFKIPLFLSMIQQRRNNLISNLHVSSPKLFGLLLSSYYT